MHFQEGSFDVPFSAIFNVFAMIGPGVFGMIVGLAVNKFKKIRNPVDILKAIGVYFLVSIPIIWSSIYPEFWIARETGWPPVDTYYEKVINELVSGSVLLIILMVVFAKIVRPMEKSE